MRFFLADPVHCYDNSEWLTLLFWGLLLLILFLGCE